MPKVESQTPAPGRRVVGSFAVLSALHHSYWQAVAPSVALPVTTNVRYAGVASVAHTS